MDAGDHFSCCWVSAWYRFCRIIHQVRPLSVSDTHSHIAIFPDIPASSFSPYLPEISDDILLFHTLLTLFSRKNQELIKELCTPAPGTKDLYFPSKYSQTFVTQCKACFWKQHCSYWRNPQYNSVRFFITIVIGLIFGLIYWNKGDKT